jgi:hypothetical protein
MQQVEQLAVLAGLTEKPTQCAHQLQVMLLMNCMDCQALTGQHRLACRLAVLERRLCHAGRLVQGGVVARAAGQLIGAGVGGRLNCRLAGHKAWPGRNQNGTWWWWWKAGQSTWADETIVVHTALESTWLHLFGLGCAWLLGCTWLHSVALEIEFKFSCVRVRCWRFFPGTYIYACHQTTVGLLVACYQSVLFAW